MIEWVLWTIHMEIHIVRVNLDLGMSQRCFRSSKWFLVAHCDTPMTLLFWFKYFLQLFLCKELLKTQKLKVTLCTSNYFLLLYINKRKGDLENSTTWGDTTMAQENMNKKAREIFTNQIQSKTQQPNKILNHMDLWIDWRFDWDGIRLGKNYIRVH